MEIRSVNGDDEINTLLNAGINSTVSALIKENMITKASFKHWFNRFIGRYDKEESLVIISKVI